ncbi:hypothetical protein Daus18300_002739 [Diaporthe australafricana]|uniref:Uncharacterized protein n=1 Tax=Diaporthe australafricana TaxID=127596 RepID=A0ABR3XL98_9PEZI
MPVLKSRWFVIDRLPPCMPPLADGGGGFLRMASFIGRETLQRLHYIDLRIGLGEGPMGSGWIWNRVLDELLGILVERNAFVHLRLLIRRCNQEDSPSIWTTEIGEDLQIRKKIMRFQMSNPNVFRPGKITVDTWRVDGQQATLLTRPHQPEPNDGTKPPRRTYPDRELFPGSIMQFVDALPEADWSDEEVERRLEEYEEDEDPTSP